MLFRRAVFFYTILFSRKAGGVLSPLLQVRLLQQARNIRQPGTMAQASRSISGVGGSMSGTITVKHPAAAPARTPL